MSNIDWKARLTNKATLTALIAAMVAFLYQGAAMVGFVPPVSPDAIINWLGILVNIAVLVGIVVDPTTEGIADGKEGE